MPQTTQALVALLTDFGTSDPYVGIMKGVIAARCPAARFIDITHEVSPQNVKQAAYLLRSAYRYFPAYTIFLVVVDPGVGTDRQPLAIKAHHGMYVGPDNGVFGSVLEEVDTWQAVVLWPPEQLSATFHGRDLFAPAAAALADGQPLHKLGTPTVDIIHSLPTQAEHASPGRIDGDVVHIDHFGNIITSIGPLNWEPAARASSGSPATRLNWRSEVQFDAAQARITLAAHEINGIQAMYSALPPSQVMGIVNSDRQLEIAVNQGNAAQLIGAQLGAAVTLTFKIRS
jgi:S-adenosyl-L-methionine hydrolase (adenosine-forming)